MIIQRMYFNTMLFHTMHNLKIVLEYIMYICQKNRIFLNFCDARYRDDKCPKNLIYFVKEEENKTMRNFTDYGMQPQVVNLCNL